MHIAKPNKNDVLCGRGGHSNKHPGNRLFRRLVNANKALYQQTSSEETSHKQIVSLSIVEAIHNQGGRFLRKQLGEWVVISSRQAYIKTSQALRETHDYSDSSCSSSQSAQSSSCTQLERKDEHEGVTKRSVISLPETLFSLSDELPTNVYSRATISWEEDSDLELLQGRSNPLTSNGVTCLEDDFEPLTISWMSTLSFSQEQGEWIMEAIAGRS